MNETSNHSPFEKFENLRAVFEGMEDHYTSEVVPLLKDLDKEREKTLTEAIGIQFFLALVGLTAAAFLADTLGLLSFLFTVVFLIVIMLLVWKLQTKGFKLDAKKTLIGGVVSFFGWTYTPKSDEPEIFNRLSKLRLFTGFDSKTFSDRIEGVAFEHKFTLTEVFLTRTETRHTTDHNGNSSTETRTVTVFNGCLLSLNIPQKFGGETIVLRRGFLFNPKKVKGLKRVGLVSSKFEKDLLAYGSDQVESRYLLPPTLMEQIIAYERAFKGKNLRFAFINQQLHIVVETGNRFEFKRLSESLLSSNRITTLLSEIAATFDLIEGLLVKRPEDWKDEFGHDAYHTKAELI